MDLSHIARCRAELLHLLNQFLTDGKPATKLIMLSMYKSQAFSKETSTFQQSPGEDSILIYITKQEAAKVAPKINLPVVNRPRTNIGYPGALRWNHQQDLYTQIHHRGQSLTHLNGFPSQICIECQFLSIKGKITPKRGRKIRRGLRFFLNNTYDIGYTRFYNKLKLLAMNLLNKKTQKMQLSSFQWQNTRLCGVVLLKACIVPKKPRYHLNHKSRYRPLWAMAAISMTMSTNCT